MVGPKFPSHLRRAAAPQHLPRRSELDALRAARKAEARGQRALVSGDWAAPEPRPAMPRQRSEGRRDMTPRRLWITAFLVAGFLSGGPARSAEPHWPETLMLATASPGGTYHAYGAGLARILTRVLGIAVSIWETAGPSENVRLHRGRRGADWVRHHGRGTRGLERRRRLEVRRQAVPRGARAVPDVRYALPLHRPPGFGHRSVAQGCPANASALARRAARPPTTSPSCWPGWELKCSRSTSTWADLAGQLRAGELDGLAVAAGVPFPAITELETRRAVRYLPLSRDQVTAARLRWHLS